MGTFTKKVKRKQAHKNKVKQSTSRIRSSMHLTEITECLQANGEKRKHDSQANGARGGEREGENKHDEQRKSVQRCSFSFDTTYISLAME